MAKKICKILVIAFVAFFAFSLLNSTYAKEIDSIDELGEEILNINPDAGYAYIIGNYAFTSGHTLTTKDVMLAARSIEVSADAGATNQDSIYGEMTIYQIDRTYDSTTWDPIGWEVKSNLVGTTTFNLSEANPMNITYVDYNTVSYYKVTFDYGYEGTNPTTVKERGEQPKATKPADPTREGYKFLGWYLEDAPYNFDTVLANDITLTAKWALDVDAIIKTAAGAINTDRYTVSLEGDNVTVVVKLDAIDKPIAVGDSKVVDNLNEALENEDINSFTISIDGRELTIGSDTALSTIKSWIEGYVGKTIDTITNRDFADKEFTVSVNLADGSISADNNNVETYTLKFVLEEKIDVDALVNQTVEKVNSELSDKYVATIVDDTVTVTVKSTAREQDIGLGILTTLKTELATDNIKSLEISGAGNITVSNQTTVNQVKTWLEGMNLVANEDLAGKEFSVKVNLAEDSISTDGNKQETYTVKFVAEPYEADIANIQNNAISAINSNDSFDVNIQENTVKVSILNQDDTILSSVSGSGVKTALKRFLASDGIASIEVSGVTITKEDALDDSALENKAGELSAALLPDATLSSTLAELVGLNVSIKINLENDYIANGQATDYVMNFIANN